MSERPLAGLRVLDLTRALAGPMCAMLLGDMGADVIKVENPEGGDETRGWGPPYIGGESGYYLSANRNKRSITINIRTRLGAEMVRQLGARSDILIENFGPGVAERYQFGWNDLQRLNPALIYCSIQSFAPGSRYEQIPGYDFVIQAMSGLMSITGDLEGEPTKVGVAVVDVLTGLYACTAILGALHERDRTGMGSHIEVALLDAALASLVNVASNYLITGARPKRWGNAHANLVPYQMLQTADGPLAVGIGNDGQFARFSRAIGRPDLAEDERFRTNPDRVRNRESLIPLLEATLRVRPAAEWISLLAAERVPAGPVNNVDEILSDPYVDEAGMVVTAPHPTIGDVRLVANPIRIGGVRPPLYEAPPRHGEHTAEVLAGVLGLTPEEIEGLRTAGVI